MYLSLCYSAPREDSLRQDFSDHEDFLEQSGPEEPNIKGSIR